MSQPPEPTDLKVRITGKVVEHLKLGSKEWFTVRLPNNQLVTINRKLVEEIEDK